MWRPCQPQPDDERGAPDGEEGIPERGVTEHAGPVDLAGNGDHPGKHRSRQRRVHAAVDDQKAAPIQLMKRTIRRNRTRDLHSTTSGRTAPAALRAPTRTSSAAAPHGCVRCNSTAPSPTVSSSKLPPIAQYRLKPACIPPATPAADRKDRPIAGHAC